MRRPPRSTRTDALCRYPTLFRSVPTDLDDDYWLPALTVTWEMAPDMQLRLNGSKTIARPQFRELVAPVYQDPESNRLFRGNPSLTDSELWNAVERYEWYFDSDHRRRERRRVGKEWGHTCKYGG